MSNCLAQRLSNRKIPVDVLAVMFGIGAWIGVNGIYVQLPLLVNSAPEQWSLPAHMVMLVQFANLGPVLYTLYIKYSSWTRDHYIIYCLLGTATVSIYLMSFLYDKTSIIFSTNHSTALLGLMFLTAVACGKSPKIKEIVGKKGNLMILLTKRRTAVKAFLILHSTPSFGASDYLDALDASD